MKTKKKKFPPLSEILKKIFGKKQETASQTSGSRNVRKSGVGNIVNVNRDDPDAFSVPMGGGNKKNRIKDAFSNALNKKKRSKKAGKEQYFKN